MAEIKQLPPEWGATANFLIESVPFITNALSILPLVNTNKVPIAGTDGRAIMVNPEGYEKFREVCAEKNLKWFRTEATARAVLLLHEAMHVVLRSNDRRLERDPGTWNQAADIVINNIVAELFACPPFNFDSVKIRDLCAVISDVGTYDASFVGKSTEEVYDILYKKIPPPPTPPPPPPGGSGQPQPPSGGTPQPGGAPSEPQEPQEQQEPQEGAGQGEDQQPGFPGPDFQDMPDSGVPDDLKALIDQQIEDYFERNGHLVGKGTTLTREVGFAKQKPPVFMKDIIKKIRDTDTSPVWSYMRPGRYGAWAEVMDKDFRLPATSANPDEMLKQIVFVLDCSGSITQPQLQAAVSIFHDAFKFTKRDIRVLQVAEVVGADDTLRKGVDIKVRVTGGTRMGSIIPYFDKNKINPSLVVLITDGLLPGSDFVEFAKWRHLPKLRTIMFNNPRAAQNFPGITFNVDRIS